MTGNVEEILGILRQDSSILTALDSVKEHLNIYHFRLVELALAAAYVYGHRDALLDMLKGLEV